MAKFCPECGKELKENSNICENCGKRMEEKANTNVSVNNTVYVQKKTNGFAIAGFVISLVSIFCCGGTAWLGLVFSIIGLVNANKSDGEGKGLAIAGIVIGAILLLLLVAFYSLGFVTSFAESFDGGYSGGYYY